MVWLERLLAFQATQAIGFQWLENSNTVDLGLVLGQEGGENTCCGSKPRPLELEEAKKLDLPEGAFPPAGEMEL